MADFGARADSGSESGSFVSARALSDVDAPEEEASQDRIAEFASPEASDRTEGALETSESAQEACIDGTERTPGGHAASEDRDEDRPDSADLQTCEPSEPELSPEQRQERVAAAEVHKAVANAHYKAQEYDEALQGYNEALAAAPRGSQESAVYHANSAACHLALKQYQECVRSCNAALEVDATYQKAILRRMAAFEALDQLDSALRDAQQILELDPSNVAAKHKAKKWEPIVQERQEKMKDEMMGKLKDLGNSVLGRFGMSLDNFKFEQDPNTGGYSVKMQQ